MLRIGLTGGIGSGKSTAASIFEVLGIPVYYADIQARRIMNGDLILKETIKNNFGEKAYVNDELNRPYISSIVFNDKEKLDLLNSFVHPATMKDGEAWMQKQKTPYAIHEAALIFEAGINKRLDYVIGVSALEELRISRAMKRSNVSHQDVLNRINHQMNEEEKMKRCDFILTNDEQQLLLPQVLALHEKLLSIPVH